MSMDNGQSLSDLFHKFIRMTVKTDEHDGKYKRKQSINKSQHQRHHQTQQISTSMSSAIKKNQRFFVQSTTSRFSQRPNKRISTINHFNVSPIPTENTSFTQTEFDEQDFYQTDQVIIYLFFFFFE